MSGEAAKSPRQIVADASAALGRVHSYHIQETQTDAYGPGTISGDVVLPGRVHFTESQGSGVAEIIIANGEGYLRANRSYWLLHGFARAADLVSDRWVKTHAASTPGFGELLAIANPATIGHCLVSTDLGTLRTVGTTTVNGQPAVVIEDEGNRAGTRPGKLFVATTGPPLPLRATETGPKQPGGTLDHACNEVRSTTPTAISATTIGAYDRPVRITAPPNAIDLTQLVGPKPAA